MGLVPTRFCKVQNKPVSFVPEEQQETPTQETYRLFQVAYDFFNARLFGGRLPECLITVRAKGDLYGYAWKRAFKNGTTPVDELAINPDAFAERPGRDNMATFVHEMAHIWQFHFGKPSRSGYHNREWADTMLDIGLTPSHTGRPGGKMTGQNMTHYVDDGGPFAVAFAEFEAMFADSMPWKAQFMERRGPRVASRPTRHKYRCASCGVQLWGKPGLNIRCGAKGCANIPLTELWRV